MSGKAVKVETSTVATKENVEEEVGTSVEELVAQLTRIEDALNIESAGAAKEKLLKGNKTTLIKGFRNNTVVLPLAVLQRDLVSFKESQTQMTTNLVQMLSGQIQQVYQAIGGIRNELVKLDKQFDASLALSGLTVEQVKQKVIDMEGEERAAKVAKEDETLNRTVVDRAAAEGDVVYIDFSGSIDGEVFEGGTSKNYHLTLGSNSFIPGFEDQLVGVSAGESKDVNVTFPADYPNKELAGKDAVFAVTVHSVKELQDTEE